MILLVLQDVYFLLSYLIFIKAKNFLKICEYFFMSQVSWGKFKSFISVWSSSTIFSAIFKSCKGANKIIHVACDFQIFKVTWDIGLMFNFSKTVRICGNSVVVPFSDNVKFSNFKLRFICRVTFVISRWH